MWQVFIEGGMQGLDASSIEAICTEYKLLLVLAAGETKGDASSDRRKTGYRLADKNVHGFASPR